MSDVVRVVVLGGGIRGATISALLAATGLAQVILIEPREIGSGASSTNHGRFHVGTWNYHENDSQKNPFASAILKANKESYKLLSQIPNATDSTKWAYYCFEQQELVDDFVDFCENQQIFYRPISKLRINRTWCDLDLIDSVIEIPEFSFNPARLAARLVEAAVRLGTCCVYRARAQRIDSHNNIFQVGLNNGDVVEADWVINAMGNWSRTIQSNLPLPRLEITLQRWELLCFSCSDFGVPPLDRVVTVQKKDREFIGLLPHGKWVVFGNDIDRETLESETEILEKHFLKPFDNAVKNEREILAAHKSYIPVLQKNLTQHLYSFSGVYSERSQVTENAKGKPTPYSSQFEYESDVQGYLLIFGGSATSALFQATQVIERVLSEQQSFKGDYIELLRKLMVYIPDRDFGCGMLWESRV
ncbi:MAG: FAD-dependent oxidoreductase [Pleurocapsa sp. MO_226.B13]|nr:FAD-dependent oxidoreductase [Pleurocapsa sp. MO_226.B13]